MRKNLILIVGLLLLIASPVFAYTIADPIGDRIGVSQFEIYGMDITHSANTLFFDIYTNYPQTGKAVGAWNTFAGDLALSLPDGNGVYEIGIAFTGHDGLTPGGIYFLDDADDWYISNNYAPNTNYIYNKNKIVTIKEGDYLLGLASVTWENISGDNPNYRWRVTLNGNDFGLNLSDHYGESLNVFYSVATCANDYIEGTYTLTSTPEPGTLSIFGLGLIGLIGFGRKRKV